MSCWRAVLLLPIGNWQLSEWGLPAGASGKENRRVSRASERASGPDDAHGSATVGSRVEQCAGKGWAAEYWYRRGPSGYERHVARMRASEKWFVGHQEDVIPVICTNKTLYEMLHIKVYILMR